MIDNIPPKKLYKYRYCDFKSHYQKLLRDNYLFFSSPKNFNDPFDCQIYPSYENGSEKQIMGKFLQQIKSDYPQMSLPNQKRMARDNYLKNIQVIKSPDLMAKRINEVANKYYGVFSLTEKCDNLLMWAHYSDCHRGFCIEFNAERLRFICLNYLQIKELILVKKIKYELDYPSINPYKGNFDPFSFIEWITTKSKDWEYETEWRLIFTRHPDEEVSFPEDIFTGIYFGVNATSATIKNVIDLFNNKKSIPIFYRAKLKHKQFGITFSQIKI